MTDCRACRANPADTPGGLCICCQKDVLALAVEHSPRRHGAAKGQYARPRTEAERPHVVRPGARGQYAKTRP